MCTMSQWSEFGLSDPHWHWMGVSPSRLCRRLDAERRDGHAAAVAVCLVQCPTPRRDDGSWALLVCGLGRDWTHSASCAGRGCRDHIGRACACLTRAKVGSPSDCQNACAHAFVHAAVIVSQIPFRRNAWRAGTVVCRCLPSNVFSSCYVQHVRITCNSVSFLLFTAWHTVSLPSWPGLSRLIEPHPCSSASYRRQ